MKNISKNWRLMTNGPGMRNVSRASPQTKPQVAKVFWFFFSKKNALACLPVALLLMGAATSHDATVALTTQPGSALETIATTLSADDLKQSRASGDTPVMLVGSAHLSTTRGTQAALFVQVQSASFCGSAGCSTSAYLKKGSAWQKILDSISGPIKVSRQTHGGMHDLLVHGHDRFVWNGTAYADTLPVPKMSVK